MVRVCLDFTLQTVLAKLCHALCYSPARRLRTKADSPYRIFKTKCTELSNLSAAQWCFSKT